MAFLPDPQSRLVIIGLDGWTDGGQASSDLARHLIEEWDLQPGPEVLDQDNYDLTVTRPEIERAEDSAGGGTTGDVESDGVESGSVESGRAEARVLFPGLRSYDGTLPGSGIGVRVVLGPEPHFGWQRMAPRVLELFSPGDRVVALGVVAADVPHTRPLPVTMTTSDPDALATTSAVADDYEGPTGFVGFLQPLLAARGLPLVTIWTMAPAYALGAPSPKAILALLHGFEDLTGLVVPQRELTEEVEAWQAGTDSLVDSDEDLIDHVRRLEAMSDASELPEASGDAIAQEIERFLKRRDV